MGVRIRFTIYDDFLRDSDDLRHDIHLLIGFYFHHFALRSLGHGLEWMGRRIRGNCHRTRCLAFILFRQLQLRLQLGLGLGLGLPEQPN